MRRSIGRGIALALLAAVAFAPAALACDATVPDLHAARSGRDIELTWTGTLALGDSWAVVRGDLNVLWDVGFNDAPLATVTTEQYTDADGAADADWDYFRVRCEGPGGDGPWSNLAFKAVREFDTVIDFGNDFQNIYYVSLPERLGIEDTADSSAPEPCAPAGSGDGVINADDLLCQWFGGEGSLTITTFDADYCRSVPRTILREDTDCNASPVTLHLGQFTQALRPGQPLQVTVTRHAGRPVATNEAVLVGSSDPARPCQTLREPSLGPAGTDCTPRQVLMSIPWDGLDRGFRELLCGREGRDWTYTNPPVNNRPSACNAGIFNDTAGFRKAIVAGTFDNVLNDTFAWSSVAFSILPAPGAYTYGGVHPALRPTDAVFVSISLGHGSTTYCPERR